MRRIASTDMIGIASKLVRIARKLIGYKVRLPSGMTTNPMYREKHRNETATQYGNYDHFNGNIDYAGFTGRAKDARFLLVREDEWNSKKAKIIWYDGTCLNGDMSGMSDSGSVRNMIWEDGEWSGGIWKNGEWNVKGNDCKFTGTWKSGLWHGGTWNGGTWEGGEWEKGLWEKGTWEKGTWKTGTWVTGTWEGGSWLGGKFEGGDWKGDEWTNGTFAGGTWHGGDWMDGTWQNGIWEVGTFKGGTWEGGTWKKGYFLDTATWKVGYDAEGKKHDTRPNTHDGWRYFGSGSENVLLTEEGVYVVSGNCKNASSEQFEMGDFWVRYGKDARFEYDPRRKKCTWEKGTWQNGYWPDGEWKDGLWEDGIWKKGTWKKGTWAYGIWKSGTWNDGVWKDGVWKDGTWKGEGESEWQNGIWKKGDWYGGDWYEGTWYYGDFWKGKWHDGTWESGNFRKGGKWYDGLWKSGLWDHGYWEKGRIMNESGEISESEIYPPTTKKRKPKSGRMHAFSSNEGTVRFSEDDFCVVAENADFTYDSKEKKCLWQDGTWVDGNWTDGIWNKGTWEAGTWNKGIWKDGIWEDGVWKRGPESKWLGGTDINGDEHLEGDYPGSRGWKSRAASRRTVRRILKMRVSHKAKVRLLRKAAAEARVSRRMTVR